ncbi:MAG: phosphoadenosine phosphosulfate reductase family protein [Deltaproteobacteria bacterium]|nr:phosphoadenosine phosphosulfate reductase family protein [Deltaproteobacteria bacterium]
MISRATLAQRQGQPLDGKVIMSDRRIREWHDHWRGDVYVSFSGGKDSTALLHLVRSIYPRVPAVFCNTGLEFPEVVRFVRATENVVWLKPKMRFREVIDKYGWPVVSKEQAMAISRYNNTKSEVQKFYRLWGFPNGPKGKISEKWKWLLDAPFKIGEGCCAVMKKRPFHKFEKESGLHGITGEMASDSNNRRQRYLATGCNAFDTKTPLSRPLSFWLEDDVWQYLNDNNVPYSDIYDMGYGRTGCVFCCFGLHMEGRPNRFERMKETHPRLWTYCMDKLGLREVLEFMDMPFGEKAQGMQPCRNVQNGGE